MRHTKENIERLKETLDEAKRQEESIVDKYSTNYKKWCKACENVNRLKRKYSKMIAEYNYDNGSCLLSNVFIGAV